MRKILLLHAGYEVLTAEGPWAGLQLFLSEEVHAVVLHDSCEETSNVTTRMKYLKPDTPIIVLCGGADQPVDGSSVADAIIRKLESPNMLLAKLSEVIHGNRLLADGKQQKTKSAKSWVA